MRGSYLATESSRDTHVVWAHLTTAELLYRNAPDTAGLSHIQLTYQGACGLKCVVQGCGRWLDQVSFETWQRCIFPYLSAQRTQKGK